MSTWIIPALAGVLTSFVPPIHNQGVSLAPSQGHAPWIRISADYRLIFVCLITDSLPVPAPFPADVICYILLCTVVAFATCLQVTLK